MNRRNYPSITRLLVFSLLLMISCPCFGQESSSKIDKIDLHDFIEMLSSSEFEGRGIDNDGQIKTQEFIINRFEELQLEPFSPDGYLERFSLCYNLYGRLQLKTVTKADCGYCGVTDEFELSGKIIETANVIGVIRGESEKAIVISAHYDHIGQDESHYYPGADDNASGVAALLELAEEFSHYENLKYTLIFLATSAEEGGLLGSLYHTEQPDFDPAKIVCNVNLDMIARCDIHHPDCNYLYCMGNDNSEMLDSIVRKAEAMFPHCTFDYSDNGSGVFERTDAYNFMKKGVPSILFFAGFHDDYHQPTDTMDKIDFDILENRIKLISEVIKLIQQIN